MPQPRKICKAEDNLNNFRGFIGPNLLKRRVASIIDQLQYLNDEQNNVDIDMDVVMMQEGMK